jgi:hypothetical protein
MVPVTPEVFIWILRELKYQSDICRAIIGPHTKRHYQRQIFILSLLFYILFMILSLIISKQISLKPAK